MMHYLLAAVLATLELPDIGELVSSAFKFSLDVLRVKS